MTGFNFIILLVLGVSFVFPASAAPPIFHKPHDSLTLPLPRSSASAEHLIPFDDQQHINSVTKTYPTLTLTPRSHTSSTPAGPGFLRGVNIGGWLVLEKWLVPDLFDGTDAIDQWTFDQSPNALQKLRNHWQTFFTEDDVIKLASYGINALRIPIGFWAYDSSGTPYIPGADIFLHQAILWARGQGMKVWIDLHGAPGSQNGFDNSGHAGAVSWQQPGNLQHTISVLQTIATKYGTNHYADVVAGIELVNEPISWGANNFNLTKQWAEQAYGNVRAVLENPQVMIVMEDAFMGPSNWVDIGQRLNGYQPLESARFAIDTHLYQVFVPEDQQLTQTEHISKACSMSTTLLPAWQANMPVYVGEWSGATNICVNTDGSTIGGSACSSNGCQCQTTTPVDQWSYAMVQQVRKYVEAQIETWEASSNGYFYWNYKAPGAWGFDTGIQKGFIPNPVTSRKYPGQCDS
ncbi:glycoside hydrolase family 5 protein [Glonium stellatum]|uniref:glucan 1,3-beta-glucosidase n=1 Tax=Glonium stellatum TaxID=574774 RepID=A0A8E2F2I5_9PEZI|nr:glycoside hydrolase family 5 protein [Glonium stellatum]